MNSRILPMFALLLAIGIFFAYVNPTWNGSIKDMKEAIASDDDALAAASSYNQRVNELAQSRDSIDSTSMTTLESFLPDSVDNVGIILDLNALAARSGLSVANIDVVTGNTGSTNAGAQQPASQGGIPTSMLNPVGSIDLTLSAVGTFGALQTFLAGVERSARILDIRDLTVQGSDTGVYQYQMTIRLYWLR